MNVHRSWWLMAIAVVALVIIGMGVDHFMQDVLVQYPLGTWRMDLDDFVGNIGTLLIGVGTLGLAWVGYRKIGGTNRKIDQVEHKLNGGMNKIVERLVEDEMAAKGYDQTFLEVLSKVDECIKQRDDAIGQRDECRVALKASLDENDKLRQWVVDRLDGSGNGRSSER